MKTPNSSMLKSRDHKHELAKDMTHETDKLSVGFNFDVHYTNNWIYLKKFDSKTRMQQNICDP